MRYHMRERIDIIKCSGCGGDHASLPIVAATPVAVLGGMQYDWETQCPVTDVLVFVREVINED